MIFGTPADGVTLVDASGQRDISLDCIDEHGRLRVMPARYYAQTTPEQRARLCVEQAAYCLPTHELIAFLRSEIAGRKAIEIGAGNGVVAEALGIPATDSYMQERPEIRAYYEAHHQPIVKYGPNVERLDAIVATERYRPEVLVACWLTHRWREEAPERGGNYDAPDERTLLACCQTLIFVGNTSAHAHHPLLVTSRHLHLEPDWLYSRALRGRNFVGIYHQR